MGTVGSWMSLGPGRYRGRERETDGWKRRTHEWALYHREIRSGTVGGPSGPHCGIQSVARYIYNYTRLYSGEVVLRHLSPVSFPFPFTSYGLSSMYTELLIAWCLHSNPSPDSSVCCRLPMSLILHRTNVSHWIYFILIKMHISIFYRLKKY